MSVYSKVLDFIQNPVPASFEALALEVFRHQFATVACYRDYCLGLGVRAESVRSLEEVPAVSAVAFKHAKLVDADAVDSPSALVFLTSGTTNGRNGRGRHFVPYPEIYRASAIAHLDRMLFPDRRRTWMLALHPTANRMPESSLARMITWCIEHFGTGRALCVADRRAVDLERAMDFLREAEAKRQAVCLLGTTASFGALFGSLRGQGRAIRLPYGSRLMDTGGAKGQVAPLDAEAVVSEAGFLLGINPSLVINEYGMTEMCSQLYDATAFNSGADTPPGQRSKVAPPWLRVAVIDPITLKPVGDGAIGLLSFFDLANVGSVSALLTEDLAKITNGAVQVLGRASTGEARGCAMGIESFAALSDARPWGAVARLE
jgi:Acyl-protein synthetase, LuxE